MGKLNIDPADMNTDANVQDFIMRQFLGRHHFITLARVINVDRDTVDVEPMVYEMMASGEPVNKGIIHSVPFWRLQRGNSAVIMNPVVGDIGLIAVCDRDISSVKATKKPALPGSSIAHNLSDAIYLGGVLNSEPTQYVEFADNQINIVSPGKINVNAPQVEVTADSSYTVNAPVITLNGAVTQGGGSHGGDAKFGGSIDAKGEVTGNGINLSSHVHGGVKSGGDSTGKPS
ncbi:Gp138 family membrane-puncturing spike protein [Xenorhabdus bovienii]|uniref:Gp138 family membrane-puncturing spike protein n=1 Tax=Xenorhabdus bovienii TaxID=40576 RepID=UPI0023B25DEF|nr:Gp138 family membrane-puncturing spike protein [Xenorhabdus bovienii]